MVLPGREQPKQQRSSPACGVACRAVLYSSEKQATLLNLAGLCSSSLCLPSSKIEAIQHSCSNGWEPGHPSYRIDLQARALDWSRADACSAAFLSITPTANALVLVLPRGCRDRVGTVKTSCLPALWAV